MGLLSSWPSRVQQGRAPVLGRVAVATSHPLAAQAGLQVLLAGGNAVDAAVATAAVLTVVEPTANGLGSDAFALVVKGAQIHGFNGSGRSPAGWTPERFAGLDAMPRRGWDSVTVPGAVSLWAHLAEAHGTWSFERLLAPAIRIAEEGFLVSPGVAVGWERARGDLCVYPDWAATFLRDGRPPAAGALWRAPDHAATLAELAATGGASLYDGSLAERLADAAAAQGGALTVEDLRAHRVDPATPLGVSFGDCELLELPPNGQGIAALIAAGVLDRVRSRTDDPIRAAHLQIEAMKIGFADAERHVADPGFLDVDPATLLTSSYLDERAATIDPEGAGAPTAGLPTGSSTVYLCVGDADGGLVSFIQSNYEGFGSGIVVPGTGIALQNRGAGFTLQPGHPNQVGPGKRPFHTIIPALIRVAGEVRVAFGVMGGPVQPQGHLQVLTHLEAGLDPQAALDRPRWRLGPGRTIWLEPGLSMLSNGLKDLGHEPAVGHRGAVFFGGGQAIVKVDGGWVAGSDARRDGQAVVA